MSKFDNYTPISIESSFNSQLVLSKRKEKYEKSDSHSSNDEIDELEALIAKKFGRERGKYNGKLPIIYMSYNKVGHIVARCLDREDRDERKEGKYKRRRDDRDYKRNKDGKGMKSCYIVEEETKNESKSNDDEVGYVSMKEDSDEDEKTSLISYVNKSKRQIIDSGWSTRMIGDKDKFEDIGPHKGGCVKFGNEISCVVNSKGTIQLTSTR